PSETLYAPLYSATSSPMRKASGSASSSSLSARPRASRNCNSVMVRLLGLGVNVAFYEVVGGIGRFIRALYDISQALFLFVVDRLEIVFGENSVIDELVAKMGDGITVAFRLQLFTGAVFAGIAHGVPSKSRTFGFEKDGRLVFARAFHRFVERVVGCEHIHPIEFPVLDAVGFCELVQGRKGGNAIDGGAHSVVVVFDQHDEGKVPDRCEVEAFVHGALVHGAIADQAHGRAGYFLVFLSKGEAVGG